MPAERACVQRRCSANTSDLVCAVTEPSARLIITCRFIAIERFAMRDYEKGKTKFVPLSALSNAR
jgi:hypothetical protein